MSSLDVLVFVLVSKLGELVDIFGGAYFHGHLDSEGLMMMSRGAISAAKFKQG